MSFSSATYDDLYLPDGQNATNPCYRKKDCEPAGEIHRQIFSDGVNNECETINPCDQQACNRYQKIVVMIWFDKNSSMLYYGAILCNYGSSGSWEIVWCLISELMNWSNTHEQLT